MSDCRPRRQPPRGAVAASAIGEVWKEHGELTSFPRAVQAKEDEVVIFAWIVYESRAQRDAINAKVMADPRLDMETMPFDGKRMIYGGFETVVEL